MHEEKRRARRFDLSLPVTMISSGAEKRPRVVQTKDISSSGIFLEFDEELRPGTKMEFVVTLPGEITQAGPVRLRCIGRVVRVDRGTPKRAGVAVSIERYEFLRLQNGSPKAELIQ